MYLWKVDSLVSDFKRGDVGQREELKYFMAFTALTVGATDPFLYMEHSYTGLDSVNTVVVLGVSLLGLYWCYRVNEAGDNREYIARVVCLGLPVAIRFAVVLIPMAFLGGLAAGILLGPAEDIPEGYETTVLEVVFGAAFMAVFYWYLGRKVGAVSGYADNQVDEVA